MMRTPSQEELTNTAYHEAGHAVAAVLQGMGIGTVSIAPSFSLGETRRGYCNVMSWGPVERVPSTKSGSLKDNHQRLRSEREVLFYLAGNAAAGFFTGRLTAVSGADLKNATAAAKKTCGDETEALAFLQRMSARAAEFVRQPEARAAIQAVKEELLIHRNLTPENAKRIITEACASVRLRSRSSVLSAPPALVSAGNEPLGPGGLTAGLFKKDECEGRAWMWVRARTARWTLWPLIGGVFVADILGPVFHVMTREECPVYLAAFVLIQWWGHILPKRRSPSYVVANDAGFKIVTGGKARLLPWRDILSLRQAGKRIRVRTLKRTVTIEAEGYSINDRDEWWMLAAARADLVTRREYRAPAGQFRRDASAEPHPAAGFHALFGWRRPLRPALVPADESQPETS